MKSNLIEAVLRYVLVAVLLTSIGCSNVFAETKTVTYTVKDKTSVTTSGTAPNGSSATFSSTTTAQVASTLYKDKKMTLTLAGYKGYQITSIKLEMMSNSSSGAGYLVFTAGTTALASIGSATNGIPYSNALWRGKYESNLSYIYPKMDNNSYAIQNGEDVIVEIGATENSLYCKSISFTYEEAPSDAPVHSASFMVNGTLKSSVDVKEGASIPLPKDIDDEYGKVFVGWCDSEYAISNTAPTFITSVTMGQEDVTYYAVFASRSVADDAIKTITVTPSAQGFPSNYTSSSEVTVDDIHFDLSQARKLKDYSQWEASVGTLYNKDALNCIQSVVLNYVTTADSYRNFVLKVGSSVNPKSGTNVNATNKGSGKYVFDCSNLNADYFVLTNGANAGYLYSVEINYLTSGYIYSNYTTTVPAPLSFVARSSEGYWATFSSTRNAVIPKNVTVGRSDVVVTVYAVSVRGEDLVLAQLDECLVGDAWHLPANTGCLLNASYGVEGGLTIDYTFEATSKGSVTYDNFLMPGLGATTTGNGCKFYRLAYYDYEAKTGLGFYYGPGCNNGEAFMCKAGTAYLAVPNNVAPNVKSFVFDGSETAVSPVRAGHNGALLYNLNGQRVNGVRRGVYVKSGKKVFVK